MVQGRPYIKVHGHWRYLYCAIDRSGALVVVMFSEHRDVAAAKTIFVSAKKVTGMALVHFQPEGQITPNLKLLCDDRLATDESGRPVASIRFNAATPMAASVR